MVSGLKIEDVCTGSGKMAERGSLVTIRWRGTLNRGDEFRRGTDTFCIGAREVIRGLEYGIIGMNEGGVRRLRVSPHLGYGNRAVPGIPANAVLNFEVELLKVEQDG